MILTACSDSDISEGDTTEHKVAIIYMSTQNSLRNNMPQDMNEIVQGAPLLKKGETLIVYLDRDEGTELYVFDRNHTERKSVLTFEKNLDSSDPATLARVLSWVREHYPAPDYGLTFWSHADGWLPPLNTNYLTDLQRQQLRSVGIDDGTNAYPTNKGTSLSIEDLATTLAASGMKFRYLFFDVCLMQGLEVDYELRNVADYIIASPISITADGAYYTHQLTNGLFSDDPVDIARTYFQDIEARVSPSYYMGIVVSAVKTSELDSLATLTRQLLASCNLPTFPNMSNVQAYSGYNSTTLYRPDYYDAMGIMSKILPDAEYALWLEQLGKCVAYKAGTSTFYAYANNASGFFSLNDDFSGVSMFVPQQKYTTNANLCPYGDHNKTWLHTSWAQAIGWPQTY